MMGELVRVGVAFLMKSIFLAFFLILSSLLNANELLQEADRYFEATLFDKALPIYIKLSAENLSSQDSIHVNIRLAQSYAALNEYEKAISVLKGKEDPKSLNLIARLYTEQKEYALAYAALDKYLKKSEAKGEERDELLFRSGELMILQEQFDEAKKILSSIGSASPFYVQAQRYLARIDIKDRNDQGAIVRLQDLADKSTETALLLGEAYFNLSDFEKAAQYLEPVIADTSIEMKERRLGTAERLLISYLELQQPENADKLLKRLDKELEIAESSYLLGRYYTVKAENLKDSVQSREAYQAASKSFLRGYEAITAQSNRFADKLLTASVEADARTKDPVCCKRALENMQELNVNEKNYVYLQALLSAYLADTGALPPTLVIQQLKELVNSQSKQAEKIQYLIALLYFQEKRFLEAHKYFLEAAKDKELAGESYFWAAKSLEALDPVNSDIKKYKQKVYEEYPQSAYADEAYFTYYAYRDYLHGDRAAIKHLQRVPELFPNSRYVVSAYYLIGMDFKRDRKSPEGKSLRKKDLNSSIEALHNSEESFDRLFAEGKLTQDQIAYYAKVRYRSILERALANLVVGDESQGAKKKIFYEYAVEVLNRTVEELKNPKHPYTPQLIQGESYPQLLEESSFWLAQGYIKLGEESKADQLLSEMVRRYEAAKITRGYFLSRVWYERALLAMQQKKYGRALEYLSFAEDSAKGKILSTDQKIDLWIQQSLCYKELGDTEKAMLTLSKAINDDAISSLRVKAMFLRAELYEVQGRHELARKQLEATSKKGGEWALKARQKMEKEYGKR